MNDLTTDTLAIDTLAIEALGAAGDGIARLDGRTVFVPGTLPGETVRARPMGKRGDALAAEAEAVLVASPDRVAPPCPHFARCGGCAIQHLADAPYAAWKRAKLVDALARAGYPDAPVGALERTPPQTRRRADLALRRGPGGTVQLGFHARGTDAVTDLTTCTVLDPRIVALFAPLRGLLKRLAALKRDGSAVVNLLETGPDLLLRTDGALDAPARGLLAAFATEHGIPRIAWAQGGGREPTCRKPRRSSAGSASRSAAWRSRRRPAPSCRPARPARRPSSRQSWPGCRPSCRRAPRSPTSSPGSAR